MTDSHDREVRRLRSRYWSRRDPEGRGFAPLAEAYRRRGELEEALALLRDGLGRLPDFVPGHLVASRVARDRGEPWTAREHLDQALGLDPHNRIALVERAELRLAEGEIEGALEDLEAARSLDPSDRTVEARILELEEVQEASAVVREAAEDLQAAPEDLGGAPELGAPLPPADDPLAPPVEASYLPSPDDTYSEFDAFAFGEEGDPLSGTPEPLPEPAESAAVSPEGGADSAGGVLLTRTMGELYAQQGLFHQAIELYQELLLRHPGDAELIRRITELRARVSGTEPKAEDPALPEPRSITDYLDDLCAWVPGAVPIASLAPRDPRDTPGGEGV